MDRQPRMHEKRQHERYHVDWPATCRDRAGQMLDVTIVDRSDVGSFGVAGKHALESGETVWLQIDGIGQFPCLVVWVKGERFGVRIIDAWSEREFEQLQLSLSED